jgi:hypothetical protein
MNIENYKTLVLNLPVRQECITTKRSTWLRGEKEIDWLKDLNGKLFAGQETLNISRQDIFNSKNAIREPIIKTIYWGYPYGMRGNHFVNILSEIQTLETVLIDLKSKENLTNSDFDDLFKELKKIPGLGLSTYSKLLYFLEIKFNNNPCLILDLQLIGVFASKTYDNFLSLCGITYNNAEKKYYLEFLKLADQMSLELGTLGENIEQFLFKFGNKLKNDK